MKRIYLDNQTTARPSQAVVKEMTPFFRERWGTIAAPHSLGQELFPAMEASLNALYKLLGAKDEDTILFTSSGAESVNHLIWSTYYDVTRHTGKNQFITSQIDEAPTIMSMGKLEELGCVIKLVDVNREGQASAKVIMEAITPRTALVSLSWANGMTGVIQPVNEIAAVCKSRGILLHLDATHVLGKLFIDLQDLPADFISFNGEQIHAPKGTGALYIRSGLRLSPLIAGGSEQAGLRGGSFSMANLAGLGKAAEEAVENQDLLCTEVARLRDKFEEEILKQLPDAVVFFKESDRLPNCSTICFPGVANDALLFLLNQKGVFASFGGGNFQKINLILAACGIDETLALSALHFSLSRDTTEEEIDQAVQRIGASVMQLKTLSKSLSGGD